MATHYFDCPDCKRECRVSDEQRAVQHSDPVCKTWTAHKGKVHEFLKLALMAKGAAVLDLSTTKIDAEADKKQRAEVTEQLHEGLKELGK